MSPQGIMSSEKASNSPGLCPVKGQKHSVGTQTGVWRGRERKQSLAPSRVQNWTIQPIASHHRYSYENIKKFKKYLKEIGREGMDLFHLAQERAKCGALLNMVMNLKVP
jgi:hypothetical protein